MICDEACQWLATGGYFSPVSSTNKTDRHDITEILLKVALKHQKSSNHQIIILFFKKCSFSLPKHRGNGEHWWRLCPLQIVSSCVLHVPELKKKGIKNKECTCILSVYTFKGNKIKTVDRNEEFIACQWHQFLSCVISNNALFHHLN
jgi:hypothetical protein